MCVDLLRDTFKMREHPKALPTKSSAETHSMAELTALGMVKMIRDERQWAIRSQVLKAYIIYMLMDAVQRLDVGGSGGGKKKTNLPLA